jgi:O-antigen ligase
MAERSEEWVFRLALGAAAATLISIAAAQILLGLAVLAWIVFRPVRPYWPPYLIPLAAFAAATLVSLAFSADPSVGAGPVRKFILFPMGLLASNFVTSRERLRQVVTALLLVASVASVLAFLQFGMQYLVFQQTGDVGDDPRVLARATGFMGHWMTFGGGQMLAWCAALPLVAAMGLKRYWAGIAIVGSGIVVGFTRSVWVGAAAATVVVARYTGLRRLAPLLVPIGAVVVLASGLIAGRIAMSFEENHTPDTSRLEMASVGVRMLGDHPLFGVGPERVVEEFPAYYRGENLGDMYYGHLHNNFLQVGAERGVFALAALVWLFGRMGFDLLALARNTDDRARAVAVSGLATLTAFVTAGLFEYNFGDSEVLMLFLFLVSVPYGMHIAGGARDSGIAAP